MDDPVRLNCELSLVELLRALDRSPLDTAVLACLAGSWHVPSAGPGVVGWGASVVRPGLPDADGRWICTVDSAGRAFSARLEQWLEQQSDGSWWYSGPEGDQEALDILEQLRPEPAEPVRLAITEATHRDEHLAAVEHAIAAIRSGDIYQVNICARLSGQLSGDPLELFLAGVHELHPDHAAFVRTPVGTTVSLSPELFLLHRAGRLRTAPIKGTRSRAVDPAELLHSRKDRAENVMIVDLMRNDLARVCRPGSVGVDRLLEVRPAPGVWHLVSEVSGQLPAPAALAEVLGATFPPGSVTGAPKLRAIEIYQELEGKSRGLFTGAVGVTDPSGAEFNVAIRTFEVAEGRFELGVGGGITADSVPALEWQECQLKLAPLLALGQAGWAEAPVPIPDCIDPDRGIFDTLLAVDGRITGLADHLARLEASTLELFGRYLPAGLAGQLQAAAAGPGRQRLRVTVSPGQPVRIEVGAAPPAGGRTALRQAHRPPGDWRHKWADRSWLETPGSYFLDPSSGLAETGTANLIYVPRRGVVRTPVLSSAVLPGVTRRRFLDAARDRGWRIELGRLDLPDLLGDLSSVDGGGGDLDRPGGVLLAVSSLRELVVVEQIDGVGLQVDHDLVAELRDWLR